MGLKPNTEHQRVGHVPVLEKPIMHYGSVMYQSPSHSKRETDTISECYSPLQTDRVCHAEQVRGGKVGAKPFALLTIQRTRHSAGRRACSSQGGYDVCHSDESAEAWLVALVDLLCCLCCLSSCIGSLPLGKSISKVRIQTKTGIHCQTLHPVVKLAINMMP